MKVAGADALLQANPRPGALQLLAAWSPGDPEGVPWSAETEVEDRINCLNQDFEVRFFRIIDGGRESRRTAPFQAPRQSQDTGLKGFWCRFRFRFRFSRPEVHQRRVAILRCA